MRWNLEKYNSTPLLYQKYLIFLLMENANIHLVSMFKDYLLYDDMTEFFKEYYNHEEIYPRLKTIYEYYESSSYLFPNYTAIEEGKYIYRNIIKKQKLIDYLEDLEDKKLEKEQKLRNKNNYQKENEQSSSYIEIFNNTIYDNIRKETWNDSKINELFCIENKSINEGDTMSSIVQLTEIIKEKNQEKRNINNKYINENNIINNNIKNKTNINNTNNYNNINKINNEKNKYNNQINKDNKYIFKNTNLNDIQKVFGTTKIISRKISINQKINSKKNFKKCQKINNNCININYITNSNIKTNKKINVYKNFNIYNNNIINRNNNINTEPSKSNDFIQKSQKYLVQRNSNININKNKTNYKKNNIIINIINSNKSNIFNANNNNYSNNFNNNEFDNINNNNNNIKLNNIYFANYINTNESTNLNSKKKDYLNYSTKMKPKAQKNINYNSIKPNKNIIKAHISSKAFTTRSSIDSNNSKTFKDSKKEIKSKLLSFRLKTDMLTIDTGLIRNLTESIKKQSQTGSMKKAKGQKKFIFNPKKNIKKRTKTEITGAKNDIFLLGQQNEVFIYNKSINRQILKNINLTNSSKQKKEISLNNKKLINSHFNLNNNTHNKTSLKNKYIKHSTTNSQNMNMTGVINKIGLLPIKDIIRKKGEISDFNKTERTSRNHSKDNIKKTNVKRKYKNSFTPKKSEEIIFKKKNKIQNKNNNAIICSFLRNLNLNKTNRNLKIKRRNNYTNYNSINSNMNNK